MIKLFLLNPLFGTNNVAKNPADAQQYTLEADSDWESAVTVPPDSYFYITNDTGLKQDVQIEVFNWKDGLWSKSKPPKVSAGDVIGTTGWTMVDTRRDLYRDQTHVLLRDPNGQLVIRTAKQDKSDPNYIQLTGEDAGHASATGGIPGMP
jgi:hypothetical protein